jgi:hypothetical protein
MNLGHLFVAVLVGSSGACTAEFGAEGLPAQLADRPGDNRAPATPDANLEACGNDIDDDGDGQTDEDCGCESGSERACYLGSPDVRGVGACAEGRQACDDSLEFPEWGECVGAVAPVPEDCFNGLDDDCDGLADCDDVRDCGICPSECDITHDYDIAFIQTLDGAGLLEPCGDGCADLWVGQIGDNYWSGDCAIFEQDARIDVLAAGAITSATLERALWDDYMQIYLNGAMVWTGPNGNFPPETDGECELSTSWDTAPGTDLTASFANEGQIDFRIRVSVTGGGEGYARIRLRYDPAALVTDRGWAPDKCIETARSITTGGCSGMVTCVDGPDASGCVVVDGVSVCEQDVAGSLEESPVAGIGQMCRRVHVNLTSCN